MDVRQFFGIPRLVGIVYGALLNGVVKYVGQELQTERRRGDPKFSTPEKLLVERVRKHLWDARQENPPCPAFGRAILKYGDEAFVFVILHTFQAIDEKELRRKADAYEQEEIARNNTFAPDGYNLTTGGQGGYVYADSVCQLISERCKKAMTRERRAAISEQNSAFTPEQRTAIAEEYRSGQVSAAALADKYGVCPTTIKNTLQAVGVDIEWGQGGHYATGENHPQAKITAETALAIYARKSSVIGTGRATAKEFGVTRQLVSRIWTGQKWGSVTGASTPS
jgi:transposase-like protein